MTRFGYNFNFFFTNLIFHGCFQHFINFSACLSNIIINITNIFFFCNALETGVRSLVVFIILKCDLKCITLFYFKRKTMVNTALYIFFTRLNVQIQPQSIHNLLKRMKTKQKSKYKLPKEREKKRIRIRTVYKKLIIKSNRAKLNDNHVNAGWFSFLTRM